jgi:hypothetical protein
LQNDKYERKVVDDYLVDGFMGVSDAIKAHTLPDGTAHRTSHSRWEKRKPFVLGQRRRWRS